MRPTAVSPSTHVGRVFATFIGLTIAGCNQQADRVPEPSGESSRWMLEGRPSLIIGTDDSRPGHDLHEVVGAVRTASGQIAIASYGNSDVRVFDNSGALAMRIGRSGEGPTDFNRIIGLQVCGIDTLAVLQQRRISLVGPSGQVERIIELAGTRVAPAAIGPASCTRSTWLRRGDLPLDTSGLLQQQYTLAVFDGSRDSTAWQFTGTTRFRTTRDGQPAFIRIPFTPEPTWAIWNDTIYWTSGSETKVRQIGSSNASKEYAWTAESVKLTANERAQYEATRDRLIKQDPRHAFSAVPWDEIPMRPTLRPASAQLLADGGEYVWIRPYPKTSDGLGIQEVADSASTVSWIVVGLRGQPITEIDVPASLRITQIRADEVIGVWTDNDGAESVRLYRLTRTKGRMK
jgi:hypothetical protein